jgi:hypothetical protein
MEKPAPAETQVPAALPNTPDFKSLMKGAVQIYSWIGALLVPLKFGQSLLKHFRSFGPTFNWWNAFINLSHLVPIALVVSFLILRLCAYAMRLPFAIVSTYFKRLNEDVEKKVFVRTTLVVWLLAMLDFARAQGVLQQSYFSTVPHYGWFGWSLVILGAAFLMMAYVGAYISFKEWWSNDKGTSH